MSFANERRGALWFNRQGEQAGITVLGGMFAGPLRLGEQSRVELVLSNADTDYTIAIPGYARYAMLYSDADMIVALEEVTSTSVGVLVKGGGGTTFPLMFDDAGDELLHVQTADAGAVITVTFLGE